MQRYTVHLYLDQVPPETCGALSRNKLCNVASCWIYIRIIINLGTRWRHHASGRFIPGKEQSNPLQGRSGRPGEERKLSTLPRFKQRFIQRGHRAEYHGPPIPHSFEPGLSGKAIDQSTVPIYHLLQTFDTRNLTSQNRKSLISVHIATGVPWFNNRGPRRPRVLRCFYSESCKRGFLISLSLCHQNKRLENISTVFTSPSNSTP